MVKSFLRQSVTLGAVVAVGLVMLLTTAAAAVTAGPTIRLTSRGNELARTTGLRRGDFPSRLAGGFVAGRPGLAACGGHRPADDQLHVGGYASASFADGSASVASKVTIYGTAAMTTVLFDRLRSSYTATCAVAVAGAPGRLLSARPLRVKVPLDYASGFEFVLRRGGVDWAGRVYILGEGRIASTLLVEQRGSRLTGGTAPLALSLLVSRMED